MSKGVFIKEKMKKDAHQKKYIVLFLITVMVLMGCGAKSEVSYAPIVCEYSDYPTCWTSIDCISTNIRIYDNNTVEVYCGDFDDRLSPTETISMDYIYGETFEITEEQKQSVIEALKKNKIEKLSDCSDKDSCDGRYSYIYLFDANGEKVHQCGGLNPHSENWGAAYTAIRAVVPEGAVSDVRSKSEEILIDYLLENYPERYDWLVY